MMYLYRATGDPFLLQVGEDILRSIQHSARTSCGYATIKNVRDHSTEDRMESFFLAETTKYLYLLFDPDNALNNDGGHGTVIDTPNGQCLIGAGGYVFNTEAHPIDMGALRCCHDDQRNPLAGYRADRFRGDAFDWMTAATEAEAEQTTQRRATEAETLLNANAAAAPPEEWRRRGSVTTATIDLDARPERPADAEAIRRKMVADILSGLEESRANGAKIMEGVGGGERGRRRVNGDDSLILTKGEEGGENDTAATGGGQFDGEGEAVPVEDDDLIHVEDDVQDDAANSERKGYTTVPYGSSPVVEEDDFDDDPVAVVKLPAPSRDADDNRSSIQTTVQQHLDDTTAATTATTSGNESADFHSDADNVIVDDPDYLVFDHSTTGDGSAMPIDDESTSADGASSHFDQQRYIDDTASAAAANASQSGAAMISDFVSSVLRAKLPSAATFNADELLERIRRMEASRTNVTQDYRLLTCRSQPFLQRLSVMGEFF